MDREKNGMGFEKKRDKRSLSLSLSLSLSDIVMSSSISQLPHGNFGVETEKNEGTEKGANVFMFVCLCEA
jgi:hypothetical protein